MKILSIFCLILGKGWACSGYFLITLESPKNWDMVFNHCEADWPIDAKYEFWFTWNPVNFFLIWGFWKTRDRQTDPRTDGPTNGQTHGWTDPRMDRPTDGQSCILQLRINHNPMTGCWGRLKSFHPALELKDIYFSDNATSSWDLKDHVCCIHGNTVPYFSLLRNKLFMQNLACSSILENEKKLIQQPTHTWC